MTKDYCLVIRIRNNRLREIMEREGFKTARALAEASGVHPTEIGKYLALQKPPITKAGEWSKTALKLAALLRSLPEDLFPRQHLRTALKVARVERKMDYAQIAALLPSPVITDDPEQLLIEADTKQIVRRMLSTLTAREERVIRGRYGFDGDEKTLEDVANEFGVSRERARQMEVKALHKMQSRKYKDKMRGNAFIDASIVDAHYRG